MKITIITKTYQKEESKYQLRQVPDDLYQFRQVPEVEWYSRNKKKWQAKPNKSVYKDKELLKQ